MLGKILRGLRGRTESARDDIPVITDVAESDLADKPFTPKPFAAKSAPKKKATSESPEALPGLPFMIRPLEHGDLPLLADVFVSAIDGLTTRDYDESQRQAWQQKSNAPKFLSELSEGVTIIAEHHDTPIAFAQLHPKDYFRMMYVHPDWAGLGIATLMYQYLEDEARIIGSQHLETHASDTARRFFESVGFKVQEEENVEVNGVSLHRTRMHKKL